nr:hypothetical protein [Rubellimicrobium arenae]
MSVVEAAANVAVGYLISVAATVFVLPVFGYPVSPADALGISVVFTVISLVRSYAIRRVFNGG